MSAPSGKQLADDLRFVREAVQSSRHVQYRSAAVPLLWAVVIAAGMALNDLCINGHVAANWSVVFWCVAPVAGFLLSCWFGYRTDRDAGLAIERGEAWRIGLHWSSIFVAALAAGTILGTNHLDVSVGGPLMLLISGLVYFLGGVHLDRRFLLPGLAAMFGSAALYHLGPYSQTIVGLVIAAAPVASALWLKEKETPAHATSQA